MFDELGELQTLEEMKRAIKCMKLQKSPGTNGILAERFHKSVSRNSLDSCPITEVSMPRRLSHGDSQDRPSKLERKQPGNMRSIRQLGESLRLT